nr:immunoglobulin light chain junction region [Macaca mulatta]MOV34730.1 immunoglobulin light chain junction region [Macaca mulatta]
FMQGLEFPFTF